MFFVWRKWYLTKKPEIYLNEFLFGESDASLFKPSCRETFTNIWVVLFGESDILQELLKIYLLCEEIDVFVKSSWQYGRRNFTNAYPEQHLCVHEPVVYLKAFNAEKTCWSAKSVFWWISKYVLGAWVSKSPAGPVQRFGFVNWTGPQVDSWAALNLSSRVPRCCRVRGALSCRDSLSVAVLFKDERGGFCLRKRVFPCDAPSSKRSTSRLHLDKKVNFFFLNKKCFTSRDDSLWL